MIAVISALSFNSCRKDFLDQKPTSTLTELSFYKTVPELEAGLVSCYASVQSSWFEVDHWVIGDIGSDDADKGSTPNDHVRYDRDFLFKTESNKQWFTCVE